MTDIFSFAEGNSPLLISIPHDGRELMPGQPDRMTDEGRALPDTDWFVRDLYAFATSLGASVIAANYSRYVVDLNRPANDAALYAVQTSTGLCPSKTFDGREIYLPGESVSVNEQNDRVDQYWRPYHDKIAAVLHERRAAFGYALLWDAHSIASQVPSLFPGVLPELNIGTNGGNSCGILQETAVMRAAEASDYSAVLNGRFKGGYITRHYGDPEKDVHAVQLELSQRCYMDEVSQNYNATSAARVAGTIEKMLLAFMPEAQDL